MSQYLLSCLCFYTCLLSVRHTPKDNESPNSVINIRLVNRRYVKDSTCLSFLRKRHQGNTGPLVERGGNNLTTLCRIVFSFKGVGGESKAELGFSASLFSTELREPLWTAICVWSKRLFVLADMKVATIDEGPRHDAPLGNFQLLSTPFSKVTDL